jgi:inorganic triphosphatase YgiF
MAEPVPTELEIKFLLPAGAESTLNAHPILRTADDEPWKTQKELTTYFDTSDHAFARSGASLRIRYGNGRHVQTLKLRHGGSAFSRGEWEWPLTGDKPNLQLLADTPLAELAETTVDLIPVFIAEVSRSLKSCNPVTPSSRPLWISVPSRQERKSSQSESSNWS